MPAVVVVGTQWGDEGKGKIVDLMTPFADVVVRYGGGANAGHTLVVDGHRVVFHLIPSGALHKQTRCVLGHGMVLDPEVLVAELEEMEARQLLAEGRVLISDRAHVVLPHHRLVDRLRDQGSKAIGTTHRGIGPCYEDKAARLGIRVFDLLHRERLRERLQANLERWRPVIAHFGEACPELDAMAERYLALGQKLSPWIGDTGHWLRRALDQGQRVLFEGAQGAMLDVDLGTYPYVTSSCVVASGASAGAGVSPLGIQRVVGVTKAYTTRVGGGPFPTELDDAMGEKLRSAGKEFGATTGRPRRCGWLDLVALRFAVQVNGVSELVMTKLDVLSGLGDLRLCVAYEYEGQRYEEVPPPEGWGEVKPIYEDFEGWSEPLEGCSDFAAFPAAARRYLARIEEVVGCPIRVVSVGADRRATLGLRDPFDGLPKLDVKPKAFSFKS